MEVFKKIFGYGRATRPSFDPNVIVARIVNHHMMKHLSQGDNVDLHNCRINDPGGDQLAVSVDCVGEKGRTKKVYGYQQFPVTQETR